MSRCPAPLSSVYLLLFIDWILYTLAFLYCDLVLSVGPGVKLHPLFFVKPSYWRGKSVIPASQCAKPAAPGEPIEVTVERNRVAKEEEQGGVRVLGLGKCYPGAKAAAVGNVQFGIRSGECFGLLGSNGAGKSTTIHMLCGVHSPTTGTVLNGGGDGSPSLDIRNDLKRIQSSMGVRVT